MHIREEGLTLLSHKFVMFVPSSTIFPCYNACLQSLDKIGTWDNLKLAVAISKIGSLVVLPLRLREAYQIKLITGNIVLLRYDRRVFDSSGVKNNLGGSIPSL